MLRGRTRGSLGLGYRRKRTARVPGCHGNMRVALAYMHKGGGLPLDGKPSSRVCPSMLHAITLREVFWTCRSRLPPRVKRWNLGPILGFPCRYDLNKLKPPRDC